MTEEKKMVIKLETITPQKAKEFLAKNTKNRDVNRRTVDTYAKQMKEGNWDDTSTPITFFKDGTLADGQHRLHAILKSNVTVQAFVCYNAPFSGNYDNGMPRNTRDQIYLGTGVKHNVYSVRVANLAIRAKYGNKYKPSTADIIQWLTDNDEALICQIANWFAAGNKQGISIRQASYILAAYSFYKNDPCEDRIAEIREVAKIVRYGYTNDNKLKGSKAVVKFRNSIISNFAAYNGKEAIVSSSTNQLFKTKLLQEVFRMYHENISGRKAIIDCPKELVYAC